MLVLMLCAIISEVTQPGVISQSTVSLLARANRTYKDSPINFMGQFFVSLFRIGTLAMAICLSLYTEGAFRFTAFWVVCGLITATLILKMIGNVLVDYTFSLSRRFTAVYEHYGNISTIAVLALYPLLLVMLYVGNPLFCQWVLGIVTLGFILMWFYRSWRIFVVSPAAILYFLLYICTLELLPLAVLYYLSAKTISMI